MLARASRTVLVLATLVVIALPDLHFDADAQPALPGPFPGLGAYANLFKDICGKQGVRWNPKELPFIGCFGLSSGSTAVGTIADRQLEVTVDSHGEEFCKVDGTTVVRTVRQFTNVPNVLYGPCGGLSFCADEDYRHCWAILQAISNNSDKSVFFYIAKAENVGGPFVTNQENWDAVHKPNPN